MKIHCLYLTLFLSIILLPKGQCQSPFAAEDLNGLQTFNGYWQGSFSFPNLAEKKLVVISIETGNSSQNLIVYDKDKQTATRYNYSFENGVVKFPHTVVSLSDIHDSCSGSVSISLLDGQHLTGSFNSSKTGCTALQVSAVKADESVKNSLLNYKTLEDINSLTEKFLGTWEGVFYQKRKDTTHYSVNYLIMINQEYITDSALLRTHQIVENGQTHEVHESINYIKSRLSKDYILLTWDQKSEGDSLAESCPINLKMRYILKDGVEYLIGENEISNCYGVKLLLKKVGSDIEATVHTPKPSSTFKDYFTELEKPVVSKPNTSNQNNKVVDKAAKKTLVKQAALKFFRWHETDWDNPIWEKKPYLIKKRPSQTFLRNKLGKPDELGNCPCTVNWKAVDTFFTWIRRNAPIISNSYLAYYRNIIKNNEPKLKQHSEEEYEFENGITGYIFWFMFAQDYIYLDKLGVYDSQAKWRVDLTSDTTATATVLFRKQQWNEDQNAFYLQMIKENGTWKLARNVSWAKVDSNSLALKKRDIIE